MSRNFFLSLLIALASTAIHAQTAGPDASQAKAPDLSLASLRNGEDWTTVSLAKSGLPVAPPSALPMDTATLAGGCTRELLRLQWRPADPVDLYIIRPAGTNKLPVALFLYNYIVDETVFQEERWCARAKENGFAVAGFPTPLSWARIHSPRPMKQWFVSQLQEALATSTHDVQMVLNYLQTRNDLDVHRVAILGQGSGGAVAILAAAADSRIAVIDLIDPWGDWPDWLKNSAQIPEEERALYLKPEFMQAVSSLDPVDYLPQLKGREIRIQQLLNDSVTPPAAKDKIAAAMPATDVIERYPDGASEAASLGANGIMAWLGTKLHASEFK